MIITTNFESFLKTATTFVVLSTDGKTPVMKEWLSKSGNCFKIFYQQGLFQEVRASMRFFRKRARKGKIFKNLSKNVQNLKIF